MENTCAFLDCLVYVGTSIVVHGTSTEVITSVSSHARTSPPRVPFTSHLTRSLATDPAHSPTSETPVQLSRFHRTDEKKNIPYMVRIIFKREYIARKKSNVVFFPPYTTGYGEHYGSRLRTLIRAWIFIFPRLYSNGR